MKPSEDEPSNHRSSESSRSNRSFMRPPEYDDEPVKQFSFDSYHRKGSQGFRKPKPSENNEKVEKISDSRKDLPEKNDHNAKSADIMLTDQEMNSLASKILKAEIMGNTVSRIIL